MTLALRSRSSQGRSPSHHSSGRVQRRRTAPPGSVCDAPLNSRSVRPHKGSGGRSEVSFLFASDSFGFVTTRGSVASATVRVPGASADRVHADRCSQAGVGGFVGLGGGPPGVTSGCGAARAAKCYGWGMSGLRPNNSFERTRSAAASGCAGQQKWRAAQLAIR